MSKLLKLRGFVLELALFISLEKYIKQAIGRPAQKEGSPEEYFETKRES